MLLAGLDLLAEELVHVLWLLEGEQGGKVLLAAVTDKIKTRSNKYERKEKRLEKRLKRSFKK